MYDCMNNTTAVATGIKKFNLNCVIAAVNFLDSKNLTNIHITRKKVSKNETLLVMDSDHH